MDETTQVHDVASVVIHRSHGDGFFPGAPKMIAEKLPEGLRRKVLAESAMQFYGMN
jgi:hypothetical protein